uniref:Uncharacterized protein n=1 Tax=Romanomermis culicivorax TaxID=13658 RepID=A0A915IBY9_ROMCU
MSFCMEGIKAVCHILLQSLVTFAVIRFKRSCPTQPSRNLAKSVSWLSLWS